MSGSIRRFVFVAAIAASALAATPVLAQEPKKERPNPNEKKQQKLDGKFEGFQGRALRVRAGDKNWYVALVPPSKRKENGMEVHDPGTEVAVTGTTSVAMLAPGAVVQFSADLDGKKMAAKEPLKTLKIVTFRAGNQIGIVPDAAPAAIEEVTPKQRAKATAVPDGPALITGRIQSAKNGKLQINVAARKPLTVEIADDAEVNVDAATVALARAGDAIMVEGWYQKEGQLYANKVEITVSAATASAGVPNKKRPAKAVAKKPADAADANSEKKPSSEKPADENATDEKAADETSSDEKSTDDKPPAQKPPTQKPSAKKPAKASRQ